MRKEKEETSKISKIFKRGMITIEREETSKIM
jgi:hypothetical protein